MSKLTSIVVEDNINALNMLVADINTHFKQLEVIGKASGVVEAVKLLQKKEPDVLFLDIMLGDGTGFDILEILPNLKSRIIFITASEEYALRAFKFAAIDYILKPYSIQDIEKSIAKVNKFQTPNNEQLNILNQLIQEPKKIPSKISLHTSEKILVIDINEIIRCKSDNNYTTFHLAKGDKILVSKTLKYYSNLLKNNNFIRVHQSHLVNKIYIKEFIRSDGGYLVLKNNTTVPVSSRKKSEVIDLLKIM